MNMKKWIKDQIKFTNKLAIPCMFFPTKSAKRVPIEKLLSDSDIQSDVLADIAQQYPVGAIIRLTELWSEAASLGANCIIKDGDFPKIEAPIFNTALDMDKFMFPEVMNKITIPLVEAIEKASKKADLPIFAGVTGPYTISSVLNGSTNFMMNCMLEKEHILIFLDKLTNYLIEYIVAYKNAGANGVVIAEPSISMISPDMAEEFSNVYIKRIIESVQDENFAVIYHNCGKISPHLSQLVHLGSNGYHFSEAVNMGEVLKLFPSDCLIMGNLEPDKFITSTPDKIKANVTKILTSYSNFIISSGCDMGVNAKEENIAAFFEAISQFYDG